MILSLSNNEEQSDSKDIPKLPNFNTLESKIPAIWIFSEEKPQGENGGQSVINNWTYRNLNTVSSIPPNSEKGACLVPNGIHLTQGLYDISITSPFYLTENTRLRLQRKTLVDDEGETVAISGSHYINVPKITYSITLDTLLTVPIGGSMYEIQYYATKNDKTGLGIATNTPRQKEKYTIVKIVKYS